MKIIRLRRTVVARLACPVCYEPARACPPRMWVAANGPRPSWSHVDGEPLCPVAGADGYRPAVLMIRSFCLVPGLANVLVLSFVKGLEIFITSWALPELAGWDCIYLPVVQTVIGARCAHRSLISTSNTITKPRHLTSP
jgi:hypothetical protein